MDAVEVGELGSTPAVRMGLVQGVWARELLNLRFIFWAQLSLVPLNLRSVYILTVKQAVRVRFPRPDVPGMISFFNAIRIVWIFILVPGGAEIILIYSGSQRTPESDVVYGARLP
ncbi:hypothetical protein B0H11DRAFT_1913603 [Mycena galericulata]|nr:hypothetical protein B0H11DRAFT_1913603 [Mycena galericulata]